MKEKKEKKILIYRTDYPEAMDVDIVECVICEIPTKNNVTALKFLKSNKKRHYSFNINHTIFDRCLANKKVELKGEHKQINK